MKGASETQCNAMQETKDRKFNEEGFCIFWGDSDLDLILVNFRFRPTSMLKKKNDKKEE